MGQSSKCPLHAQTSNKPKVSRMVWAANHRLDGGHQNKVKTDTMWKLSPKVRFEHRHSDNHREPSRSGHWYRAQNRDAAVVERGSEPGIRSILSEQRHTSACDEGAEHKLPTARRDRKMPRKIWLSSTILFCGRQPLSLEHPSYNEIADEPSPLHATLEYASTDNCRCATRCCN